MNKENIIQKNTRPSFSTGSLAKRIIPCLDIKDGRTVKGTNFINHGATAVADSSSRSCLCRAAMLGALRPARLRLVTFISPTTSAHTPMACFRSPAAAAWRAWPSSAGDRLDSPAGGSRRPCARRNARRPAQARCPMARPPGERCSWAARVGSHRAT